MTWKHEAQKPFRKTLQKTVKVSLRWLSGIAVIAACTILAPTAAQACRDCPFPTRIGDNQWLMPDSHLLISIFEHKIDEQTMLVKVLLRDQRTGEFIARGTALRLRDQRSLTLTLRDSHGRRVRAQIYWVTFDEPVIQAKFDCDENENRCSLTDRSAHRSPGRN